MEWAEDSLQQAKRISVPEDIYNQGCVKDVEEGLEVSTEPGVPGPTNLLTVLVVAKLSNL